MADHSRKLKKQSGTKSEELLKSSTFFLDRCLGTHVGKILREHGLTIEFHQDHFAEDEKDEVWLRAVGARGWIVLSKDKMINKRPAELNAVNVSNVRMFMLQNANLTGDQMAEIYVKHLLNMGRLIKKQKSPFIARLSLSEITLVFPRAEKKSQGTE